MSKKPLSMFWSRNQKNNLKSPFQLSHQPNQANRKYISSGTKPRNKKVVTQTPDHRLEDLSEVVVLDLSEAVLLDLSVVALQDLSEAADLDLRDLAEAMEHQAPEVILRIFKLKLSVDDSSYLLQFLLIYTVALIKEQQK